MAEIIEETAAVGCTATFGELLRMLLKLGNFGLLDGAKSIVVEIVLLQPASQVLISAAAHAKHWEVPSNFVVISDVGIGIKGLLILLDRSLLIKPVTVSVCNQCLPFAAYSLMPMAKSR